MAIQFESRRQSNIFYKKAPRPVPLFMQKEAPPEQASQLSLSHLHLHLQLKMKQFNFLYLAALGCALANPLVHDRQVSYEGYGVYRVPVGDDVSKVTGLIEDLGLETWKSVKKAGTHADVVVPPEKLSAFKQQTAGIEGVEVMHENLAVSIAAEQEPAMVTLSDVSVAAINTTWFSSYHSYADHLSYLKNLATLYPNNAAVVTSGTSLQGNTITGIHIYGSSGAGVKPAVVFHGTVHAREWITNMVREHYSQDCESLSLLLTMSRWWSTPPTPFWQAIAQTLR